MYKLSINKNGQGEIQISDFKESFFPEFSFWAKSDYESHWKEASSHLLDGKSVSFITSISEPDTSNFIRSWACYPVGEYLVFQEQILFLNDLERPFNLQEPHKNSLPYESVDEDGNKISEWKVRRAPKM